MGWRLIEGRQNPHQPGGAHKEHHNIVCALLQRHLVKWKWKLIGYQRKIDTLLDLKTYPLSNCMFLPAASVFRTTRLSVLEAQNDEGISGKNNRGREMFWNSGWTCWSTRTHITASNLNWTWLLLTEFSENQCEFSAVPHLTLQHVAIPFLLPLLELYLIPAQCNNTPFLLLKV